MNKSKLWMYSPLAAVLALSVAETSVAQSGEHEKQNDAHATAKEQMAGKSDSGDDMSRDGASKKKAAKTEMSDEASKEMSAEKSANKSADTRSNPFFSESDLPFKMPRFDKIKDSDFKPAMEKGMARQIEQIEKIANNPEPATFDNTIVAMERSGQLLTRVLRVFQNLASADTNDKRQALQREMSPQLSAHQDEILLNGKLFDRIDTLYEKRDDLDLNAEDTRLLKEYHRDFVRAGANLSDKDKQKLREMNTRLARLTTEFSQNVLKQTNNSALVVDSAEKLKGMDDAAIEAAASEAANRGLDGKYVITLQNTSGQPPLASLENRKVRERLHKASLGRGSRGNDYDNTDVVSKIVKTRAERAKLLGYDTHADYVLEVRTAKTVDAVEDMLGRLAPVAVENARAEAADLQAMIDETEDEPFELKKWDWAYYTDKLRQKKFDFDESEIRSYFEMNNVLENGVFYAAGKLYGLSFKERPDLPVYRPDVRVYEVFDADDEPLAIFIADYYKRESKRGGAWMNAYETQSDLLGGRPVIANHLNIPKPPEGEPTLLTLDEVTTMFHEFGHALHGMFSDVTYPKFSGTSVPRDFVEFPSQVNEMWATWPEVLENYALNNESGERIPQDLLDRVIEADKFNEGFRTTEYLEASILDMCYHTLQPEDVPAADEVMDFEHKCLEDAGVAFAPVPPRYRSPYFSHSMGGYSAGYYSYIWSEVLDADTVKWIKEHGGLKRKNGDRFRNKLLSRGGSKEAMQLFRDFSGRDPNIEPLLKRRGLTEKSDSE